MYNKNKIGQSVIAPTEHVVVRVRSDQGNTIASHQALIDKHGRVLFAKIGKGLSDKFIEQLTNQINQGITTYCFVATYEGWNTPFGFYQGELLGLHKRLKDEQKELVPEYIQSVSYKVGTWFEIQTLNQLSEEEAKRIFILTSGRDISEAMGGTTATFRVGITGSDPMKLLVPTES